MTDNPLDEYCDCKVKQGFIGSGRFLGDHETGREYIYVCLNCGRIHVIGERNGQHFHISFHITIPEHLEAIKKWVDYVNEDVRK